MVCPIGNISSENLVLDLNIIYFPDSSSPNVWFSKEWLGHGIVIVYPYPAPTNVQGIYWHRLLNEKHIQLWPGSEVP